MNADDGLQAEIDRCNTSLAIVIAERDDLKIFLEAAKIEAVRLEREIEGYREELRRSFAFNSERERTIADLQRRLDRVLRVTGEGHRRVEIERDADEASTLSERRRARIAELGLRFRTIVDGSPSS